MLRFNIVAYKPFTNDLQFQYILCYGSTHMLCYPSPKLCISIHPMLRFNVILNIIENPISYFNTSYVTVQHVFFTLFYNFINISIHPMLRFNHWCYVIYIFYHTGKRLIQQVFIKIFPMTGIFFRKEQKIGFDICVSGLLFSCLYFIIGKYKMVFSFCVFAVINYPSNHF